VLVACDNDIIASNADLRGLVLLVAQKTDCVQSYFKLGAGANEGAPNWLCLHEMEGKVLSSCTAWNANTSTKRKWRSVFYLSSPLEVALTSLFHLNCMVISRLSLPSWDCK